MELVLIKIPRNTKRVVGPLSLLGARGIPTEEAMWRMVLTLWAKTDEWAGPTMK